MCTYEDSTPKKGSAKGRVLIENNRTRITEWSFSKRGDNTGWHEHEYDYVVVPMFTGNLDIFDGEHISVSAMIEGEPYFRIKGVKHDVINGNDFPCKFIEIEYL